jgi:hypothetical protein
VPGNKLSRTHVRLGRSKTPKLQHSRIDRGDIVVWTPLSSEALGRASQHSQAWCETVVVQVIAEGSRRSARMLEMVRIVETP